MIRSLIDEKRELEENMKMLKQVVEQREIQTQELSDLQNQTAGISQSEMQRHLQETFQDIFEQIDNAQVQSLHVMSQKQNEMFQLATKNKLPSAFRNESLGLWYDAKSTVAQCLADLKTGVNFRKQNVDIQMKVNLSAISSGSNGVKLPMATQDSNQTLKALNNEFYKFKQVSQQQSKKLSNIQLALKVKDQVFKEEKERAKAQLKDLTESLLNQQTIVDQRSDLAREKSGKTRNMSPFEKRLQTYQASSIQRSTQARSGSRGKGQTIQRVNSFGEPEARQQNSTSVSRIPPSTTYGGTRDGEGDYEQTQQELRVIRTNLEKFSSCFEAMTAAFKQKQRYDGELNKLMDSNIQEQGAYIGQCEQIMHSSGNALNDLRALVNESDINRDPMQNNFMQSSDVSPTTPTRHQMLQQHDAMSPLNKVRSQKVQELQHNNDQLFSELKKANEKYLDARVENNKLKDQIVQLKQSTEQMKAKGVPRSTRAQSAIGAHAKKKVSATQREDSVSHGLQLGKQMSQGVPAMIHQEADAELRKKHDILQTQTEQLCKLVEKFMHAMRQLQKAVNRKEKDVSAPKKEFETSKKELEQMVQQVKTKIQGSSLSDKLEAQAIIGVSQRNILQSRDASGFRQAAQKQIVGSSTQRPQSNLQSGSNLNRKAGLRKTQTVAEDENDPQHLLRMVRSLQMEKDKLKELIEELRQANQLYQGERDLLDEKLKTKSSQLHKFASQCQSNAQKIFMLDQVLAEYKVALADLESNQQNRSQEGITQLKSHLQAREAEYARKFKEEVARMIVNLKADPHLVALKDELIGQVQLKEKLLDQQFQQLSFKLADKEEDLQRVKLLFVEKLRELESSFVEISQEVVENDNLHQEIHAKRKKEQLIKQEILNKQELIDDQRPMNRQDRQDDQLDRSMEHLLQKYENGDEKDQQIEELAQANQELLVQNENLKKKIAEQSVGSSKGGMLSGRTANKQIEQNNALHTEMVIELNDQIDELKIEADKLRQGIKDAKSGEAAYKKEIQALKYTNKTQSCDLKDAKERFEKIKVEYQSQFTSLKQTTVAMKQQLQKEYDQRIETERKLQQSTKSLKVTRADNQTLEAEIQLLMKAIEEMQYEQRYLQELRGEFSDEEPEEKKEPSDPQEKSGEQAESPSPKKDEEKEFDEKLAEGAEECARQQFRLLQATKKEYKILKKQHELQKEKNEVLRAQLQASEDRAAEQPEQPPENVEELKKEAASLKEKQQELQKQLEDAQAEKQKLLDSSVMSNESDGKIKELEQSYQQREKDLIQTYKRIQRQSSEKAQAERDKLAEEAVERQKKDMEELRQKLEADQAKAIDELQTSHNSKFKKADKGTKLVIALTNYVREIMRKKLSEAEQSLAQVEVDKKNLQGELSDLAAESNQRIELLQKQLAEFTETTKKQRQELMQQFEDDKKSLEGRLKSEREAQESKLKESEVEKLDRIKKQLAQEKEDEIQRVRRERDEAINQIRNDLEDQQTKLQASESRSMEEKKKHSESLKALQSQAIRDQQAVKQECEKKVQDVESKTLAQVAKQERGTQLVIALQTRVRNLFERNLKLANEETARLLSKVDEVEKQAKRFEQDYASAKETHQQFKQDSDNLLKNQQSQLESLKQKENQLLSKQQELELSQKHSLERLEDSKNQNKLLEDVHIQLKHQISEKEQAYKDAQSKLEEKEKASQQEAKELREKIESQQKTLSDESIKAKDRIEAAEKMAENLKTVIANHEAKNGELQRRIEGLEKAAQEAKTEHAEQKRAMEQKQEQERLLQESALKDSELQKLDLIKKQLNAQKEDEIQQLKRQSSQENKKQARSALLMACLHSRVREILEKKINAARVELEQAQRQSELVELKAAKFENELKQAEEHQTKFKERTDQLLESQNTRLEELQAKEGALIAKQKEFEASAKQEKALNDKLSSESQSLKQKVDEQILALENATKKNIEYEKQLQEKHAAAELAAKKLEDRLQEQEKTMQDGSVKAEERLNAAEAMIQSLKSVQEALEREKRDLQDQNEQLDEILCEAKTELLQVKGQLEVQETAIEELNDQKAQTEFELTDTKMSLNMQLSAVEQLTNKLKITKEAKEAETAAKSIEIDELKKELQNLTFIKEKYEPNTLADSEGRDQSGLRELEKEHSSIMEPPNDYVESLKEEIEELKAANEQKTVRIEELEAEVDKLQAQLLAKVSTEEANQAHKRNDSWNDLNSSGGRDSWGSDRGETNSAQKIEEHLKHVRSIMIQFLSKLPFTTKENEDILPVIFSMLNFTREDIEQITQSRAKLKQEEGKPAKKGIFGGLKKQKK